LFALHKVIKNNIAMSIQTKNWAALVISKNDLDPESVSMRLKLNADFSAVGKEGEDSIWQLHSRLSDSEELESHIWDLLKRIALARNELRKLVQENNVVIYCSTDLDPNNSSGIRFSPRLMNLLGNLGVVLEIHLWENERIEEVG
jgi:hypothetical protein